MPIDWMTQDPNAPDKRVKLVDDLFDVDQIFQNTLIWEDQRARLTIDGHVYNDDVDDEEAMVTQSADNQKSVKAHQELHEKTLSSWNPSSRTEHSPQR